MSLSLLVAPTKIDCDGPAQDKGEVMSVGVGTKGGVGGFSRSTTLNTLTFSRLGLHRRSLQQGLVGGS